MRRRSRNSNVSPSVVSKHTVGLGEASTFVRINYGGSRARIPLKKNLRHAQEQCACGKMHGKVQISKMRPLKFRP